MPYEADNLALYLLQRVQSYKDKGGLGAMRSRNYPIGERESVMRALGFSETFDFSETYRNDFYARFEDRAVLDPQAFAIGKPVVTGERWSFDYVIDPRERLIDRDRRITFYKPSNVGVISIPQAPQVRPLLASRMSVGQRLLDCLAVSPYESTRLFCQIGIAVLIFNLLLYFLAHTLIINPILSFVGIPACWLFWLMALIGKRSGTAP